MNAENFEFLDLEDDESLSFGDYEDPILNNSSKPTKSNQ